MSAPAFLHNRAEFRPLPVELEHMDLELDFLDGEVRAANTLRIRARQALEAIELDAWDLEIHSVHALPAVPLPGAAASPEGTAGLAPAPGEQSLTWQLHPERRSLAVALPRPLAAGETACLRTRTTCRPTDNILEGLYYDTTPPGCPPQIISQCEQWGFERIAPVFDDCTAKCTMTTTIEADARYTHLISNGDVSRERHPDGRPLPVPNRPGRRVITYENRVPMAPYLFFAGVGTWDVLEREIEYPGGKRVRLEYLVPPGRGDGARLPLDILAEAVLWQGRTQEYEYRYDVYRTICMEKSNFGGMENVGNTTIITSAALIDEYISDARLIYAYGVIIHEFEHNQCGSDVTMETPFDMWLNEAMTVDVERQFTMSRFDPDVTRLDHVEAMRAPLSGPLAIEDGGHRGRIVREGFNHPDELVDGVTYVKAAEVIRMLKLILGPETYRRAKNLYFRRYDGANANTDQFFACFEEASGRDLAQFRREWLHTIGYPRIEAVYAYDRAARRLRLELIQTRSGEGGLFHIPFEMAAVSADGEDIGPATRTVELTGEREQLIFEDIPEPAFLSLNRDCSFYGTFHDRSATEEQLRAQIRLDPNLFNRVEAMRRLTDLQRIRLIEDEAAAVDDRWLDTVGAVVRDRALPPGLKSYLLRIEEQSLHRAYLPRVRERYRARRRLLGAVAARHRDALLAAFEQTDTYRRGAELKDGLDERRLKGVLLRILIELDDAAVHDLAEAHFRRAWNVTDKQRALECLYISTCPRRLELLEEAYALWRDHLAAYTGYLSIIGRCPRPEVFARLAFEEGRPPFRIEHPGHARALFLPLAANNAVLWTDAGIAWVRDTVIRLAPVNEFTANHVLSAFQMARRLAADLKPKVMQALQAMQSALEARTYPSTRGRIDAFLASAGER